MKLMLCCLLVALVGLTLAQKGNSKRGRFSELRKEMKLKRQQRMQERLKNTYRWMLVLDDEAKTEVKQGAFVNTNNKTIIVWTADRGVVEAGFNRTIMLQDDTGMIAIRPLMTRRRRGGRRPRRFRGKGRFGRDRRQATNETEVETSEVEKRRDFGKGGRRFGGKFFGKGRRGGFKGRGNSLRRRFGFKKRVGSCFLIPANATFDETVATLKKNNDTGNVTLAAERRDFQAAAVAMTEDEKTTFKGEHSALSRFCAGLTVFDAQTATIGTPLAAVNDFRVIDVFGAITIRVTDNTPPEIP